MDIRSIVSLLDYKRYDNMILDIPYPSTYVAQEVQYTDMKLLDEAIIRTMVEFTYRLWGSEECYYIFFYSRHYCDAASENLRLHC